MMLTTLQRFRLSHQILGWQGGSGPQLLLIHGVGMHADYWSNLIPTLMNHFSLTVIDMPGHGESPTLAEEVPTLFSYTDSINQLIHDNTDPILVAGHSMGAMIAIDLASRHPKSVSAIVALNAVYQRSVEAMTAVRTRAESIDEVSTLDNCQTLERWFGHEPEGVNAQAAAACAQWLSEVNQTGYRQAYRAFAFHDGPDRKSLQQLRCPALFMTGEDEPNSTPAMSSAMASIAKQGDCHIIKGARHMMSMTHGTEVLARLLPFLLSQDSR